MEYMSKVITLLLGLIIMALSVTARAQSCDSAELRDVTGNVLVSTKDGMSAAVDKQSVAGGTRVTTTARASVTIVFACGCVVSLKENERIDLGAPATCTVLQASVVAVPVAAAIGAGAGAGATASAGVFSGTTALIASGVGVGGYLIYRNNRNQSPN
jgi:hypothetical protein